MKKYLPLIIVLPMLAAIAVGGFLLVQSEPAMVFVSPVTGLPTGTDGYPWWNDSIFYEIFVRSFYDSDGDGIGDFNGITAKLDYLNDGDPETTSDLGITGIWLMPINPSPSYHGYDVTDFMNVNPEYGTMDDFKNLIAEAHAHGIRIIIDMVLNHTSTKHPWFQASRDPASPFRDYYLWVDEKPNYNGPWGQKVWIAHTSGYYYALFWDQMPDLNYTNPDVTAEMDRVINYWLTDVGVDGFRLDAIKYIVEEGAVMENAESTHAWLEHFRSVYKVANPQALTVGEVWDDLNAIKSYIQGNELDTAFQFGLAEAFVNSANSGNAGTAIGELRLTYKLLPPLQYAPFLTNHDINRVMSQLGGDINKSKVAASMLLTAPGVPFLYYGEEVGLMGMKPDEDIRRPMQWSGDKNAGFSIDFPWRNPGKNWETNNVAAETDDPMSLLSHYRTLIQVRNQHAALRVGDTFTLRSKNPAIYAILRLSDTENVMVVINLSDKAVTDYYLTLEESSVSTGDYSAFPILGAEAEAELTTLTINEKGGFTDYTPLPEIPAFTTLILQFQMDE